MDSLYNYLINLVFNSIGSEKAIAEVKKVEQQVTFPWDTKGVDKMGDSIGGIGDKSKLTGVGLSALSKDLEGFTSILKLSKNTYDEFGNVSGTVVTEKLKNQFGVMKQVTTQFDANGKAIKSNVQDLKGATIGMGDFVSAMRRALIVAPIWMIMRAAIQGVTSLISSQIKFLLDMEDAMARIKIVGKGTADEFDHLKNTLVALSYIYGVSASAALDAAQIFAQQGRSVSETLMLTRAAMIGSKALGTDIKDVINDLTAAIEGFGIPVDKAITIIDRWVAVEKEFAVTSKDLADATKVTAASANQLGISMSEFLGDVTAVIEVTRKSGSEAARGLSFIYARLLTSGKETIEQITKIPFYLDAQGKSTSALTDKMRSVSDILGDLAGKWDGLTTAEKLEIATSLGSKRQMTVMNALMQNYSRSVDATLVSLTSAGNAERAFGILQETTRLKLTQLNSAWNNLTNAIGNTSAFKSAIDSVSNLIIELTKLVNLEAGIRVEVEKNSATKIKEIEYRQNEIASIEELIVVKQKLEAAPKTEENLGRLDKINAALKNIINDFPGLDIVIKEGTPEKLKSEISNISDNLAREHIKVNVETEFLPKNLTELNQNAENIRKSITFGGAAGLFTFLLTQKKTQKQIDDQILGNNKKQAEELDKQYKTFLGQKVAQKTLIEGLETEQDATTELDDKEKERLDNEKELIKLKVLSGDNTVALISKEIELVNQSKYQYDTHEKSLKLRELENKLIEATISTNDKLVSNELELARIRGASSRQLFELDAALKIQLYGENAIKSSLDYRLSKEKELTKEKLHQNDLSSNSMKIYEIAQENGISAATTIAKFLNGTISFDYLREMSGAYKIFRDKFSDLDKQMRAWQYFSGRTPGAVGANLIPIPEKFAVNIPTSLANIEKERAALAQNINISPSFGGININLPKGTLEELANLSGKKLTEMLKTSKEFKGLFEQLFWSETGKGK